jgi:asparagine synthase (glutamine-hydrolysing)
MRLICGVFHLDGKPVGAELLEAMCAQMVAPGLHPRIRTWRGDALALAVLDFAARADQGYALPQRADWTLAADVRLDAPRSLAESLAIEVANDDHLLLAALQHGGAAAPLNVPGDYAFAAWDRSTQTLLCGRDAFGIRPFVYIHQPRRLFAFASLPRALHGAGLIAKKLDERGLALRIVQAYDEEHTLFQGIHRLPPAHVLEVKADGFALQRYWQLNPATAGTRRISPEDAAHEMRALVEEAVRCRLPAEGPVAAHLSGGLDSSAVSILAARMLRPQGRTLLTYSFLPQRTDDFETEKPFVDAVREQEPDIVWMPIRTPRSWLPRPAETDTDQIVSIEPDDSENATCADAAAHGAELVLSGFGGDQGATFNARGGLSEALLHGRWRYLATEMAALNNTRGWRSDQVWRYEILPYLMPRRLMAVYRRLRGRRGPLTQPVTPVLKDEVWKRLGYVPARLLIGADARMNRLRLLASTHISERSEYWASIGARYGLAFAFPLLDRRIVEFALSLPSWLFLRGGFKRRVFRDAMAGVLPELIRWRHNKLQPMPDTLIMAADGRTALARRLAEGRAHPRAADLFDFDYLDESLAKFPSAAAVRAGSGDFAPMVAVLWALGAIAYVERNY